MTVISVQSLSGIRKSYHVVIYYVGAVFGKLALHIHAHIVGLFFNMQIAKRLMQLFHVLLVLHRATEFSSHEL